MIYYAWDAVFNVIYQKRVRGFYQGLQTPRNRWKQECFYCFEVFGTPDETQSTSFWDDFSNDTIKKYAVIHVFVIVLPKWKNNNLCSEASLQYDVTLLQQAWLIVLVSDHEWRFREPKAVYEERELILEKAIPSSTKYKNKWAVTIFG